MSVRSWEGRADMSVERFRMWRGWDLRRVVRSALSVVSGSLKPVWRVVSLCH